MRSLKLKLGVILLILLVNIMISTSVLGANENIQVLKESDTQYLIYLKDNLNTQFEFAISDNADINKDELIYEIAAKEIEGSNTSYVAYIDKEISGAIYLWARTLQGEYIAEAIEIDISQAIEKNDIELINNITKKMLIDTTKSITTEETKNEVKITKTIGTVEVLDEEVTHYQLIKLPSEEGCNQLMKLAEEISNSTKNNMYEKLELVKEFATLYREVEPEEDDENWLEIQNNTVLQPENSKQDEQYILWIKSEENGITKVDAQFLTCFEDYKPEYISEKIITKLPVTYDNPILFIVLAVLVIAFIVVFILKKTTLRERDIDTHEKNI